ncbi:MAG: hypothetical protein ACFB13_16505, partial [Kiloniellaceae bacterium]
MQFSFSSGFWPPGFWPLGGGRDDLASATRLLTRLPLGTATAWPIPDADGPDAGGPDAGGPDAGGPEAGDPEAGGPAVSHPARCYPRVGAGVGLLSALAYSLACWLALPPFAAALAALAAAILVTG